MRLHFCEQVVVRRMSLVSLVRDIIFVAICTICSSNFTLGDYFKKIYPSTSTLSSSDSSQCMLEEDSTVSNSLLEDTVYV